MCVYVGVCHHLHVISIHHNGFHGHERHPRPLPGTSQLHLGTLGALTPREAEIRVARSSGTCSTENWGMVRMVN